jgi:hypothetical protein
MEVDATRQQMAAANTTSRRIPYFMTVVLLEWMKDEPSSTFRIVFLNKVAWLSCGIFPVRGY